MARTPISARGSRRVLFASLGLVAGALLGAGALTACGAPATTPGLVVPTVTSVQPAGVTGAVDITTPTTAVTTTTPTHPATTHPAAATHAAARPATTHTSPPTHRATHTATHTAPPTRAAGSCSGDYYRNSSGTCVHRPVKAAGPPAGATAQCNDGSYSFSQHHRGTCSGHGGVSRWL
jgi:hypothetical protein